MSLQEKLQKLIAASPAPVEFTRRRDEYGRASRVERDRHGRATKIVLLCNPDNFSDPGAAVYLRTLLHEVGHAYLGRDETAAEEFALRVAEALGWEDVAEWSRIYLPWIRSQFGESRVAAEEISAAVEEYTRKVRRDADNSINNDAWTVY